MEFIINIVISILASASVFTLVVKSIISKSIELGTAKIMTKLEEETKAEITKEYAKEIAQLQEEGRQQAKRDNIEEITRIIESVKTEFIKELKALEKENATELHRNQEEGKQQAIEAHIEKITQIAEDIRSNLTRELDIFRISMTEVHPKKIEAYVEFCNILQRSCLLSQPNFFINSKNKSEYTS